MIALTKINKRHGNQVLFVEASMQLDPGEKVGLVGPNGSGKSTLFRLITGEEKPDDGDVSLPKRVTIGHFRQEQGDMKGRSVLDEVIAGSGKLGELHHEIEQLQQPGYNVVNFRLAWDFNDDRSRIAFWAKNLTDTEYYNSALAFPRLTGSVTRYYDAPRTFGVELSQRF